MDKTQQAVEIYEIIDPRDGSVRYIGKANNTQKRFKQHLRDARRLTRPIHAWLSKMVEADMIPQVRVVAMCRHEHWQEVEKAVIAQGRADGYPLLNLAEGGDDIYCSPEVRKELGHRLNARIKKEVSPQMQRFYELKRLLGIAISKGQVSEKTRARMREGAARHPGLLGDWANV